VFTDLHLHTTFSDGTYSPEELASEGSEVEVVDLRSVKPLDTDTIMASVARTGRLLCVGESWPWGGVTAEVIARVATEGFALLDAPPQRLNAKDTPVPYHPDLWAVHRPTARSIATAARPASPCAPANLLVSNMNLDLIFLIGSPVSWFFSCSFSLRICGPPLDAPAAETCTLGPRAGTLRPCAGRDWLAPVMALFVAFWTTTERRLDQAARRPTLIRPSWLRHCVPSVLHHPL
jgi:hypothetical protein